MRINVLAGSRFHSVSLIKVLSALGEDVAIYTSSPRRHFKSTGVKEVHFVPLIGAILQRLSGWDFSRLDEAQCLWFDRLASYQVRPCHVLHGWAGFSLITGRKVKNAGGSYFLERSCPHLEFQETIIEQEAEVLELPYRPKSKSWIERSLAEYEAADKIIVPSNYTLNTFLSRGFPEKKMVKAILDRPVEIPQVDPSLKNPSEFVLGCLGGNIFRKGFSYLLEAWNKLNLPNSRLIIKGPEKEMRSSPKLNRLINERGNVEIFGYFPNINHFYQRCDAFCLPSVDDGFGLVVMEAMANGLPVISTSHVGASEILEGRPVGKIVPPANSEKLAEAILSLYQNHHLRNELGANALSYVKELNQRGSSYPRAIEALYRQINLSLSGAHSHPSRNYGEIS